MILIGQRWCMWTLCWIDVYMFKKIIEIHIHGLYPFILFMSKIIFGRKICILLLTGNMVVGFLLACNIHDYVCWFLKDLFLCSNKKKFKFHSRLILLAAVCKGSFILVTKGKTYGNCLLWPAPFYQCPWRTISWFVAESIARHANRMHLKVIHSNIAN